MPRVLGCVAMRVTLFIALSFPFLAGCTTRGPVHGSVCRLTPTIGRISLVYQTGKSELGPCGYNATSVYYLIYIRHFGAIDFETVKTLPHDDIVVWEQNNDGISESRVDVSDGSIRLDAKTRQLTVDLLDGLARPLRINGTISITVDSTITQNDSERLSLDIFRRPPPAPAPPSAPK